MIFMADPHEPKEKGGEICEESCPKQTRKKTLLGGGEMGGG